MDQLCQSISSMITDLSGPDGKYSQGRVTELPELPHSPHIHDLQLCLLPK